LQFASSASEQFPIPNLDESDLDFIEALGIGQFEVDGHWSRGRQLARIDVVEDAYQIALSAARIRDGYIADQSGEEHRHYRALKRLCHGTSDPHETR